MKLTKGLLIAFLFFVGCSASSQMSQESACDRVQALTVQIENYEASIAAAQNGLQASASSADTEEYTRRIGSLSDQVRRARAELESAVQQCEAGT